MFAVATTSDVPSSVARCSRPASLTLVPWQLRNDPLSGGAAVLPRCSVLLGLDNTELGQLQAPRTSHVPGAWGDSSHVCPYPPRLARVLMSHGNVWHARKPRTHVLILLVVNCCLRAPYTPHHHTTHTTSTHMTRSRPLVVLAGCQGKFARTSVDESFWSFLVGAFETTALPSTCTLASVLNGQGCKTSLTFPSVRSCCPTRCPLLLRSLLLPQFVVPGLHCFVHRAVL